MALPDESIPSAPAIGAMLQDLGLRIRSLRKETSMWVALARQPQDLGALASDPRWVKMRPDHKQRTWTDDYSNVLGIMR